MLFPSGVFLALFLPAVLAVYLALRPAVAVRPYVLLAASILFYTYWDWRFTPILLGSILANHLFGSALARIEREPLRRRLLLAAGIAWNLGLLGWFKYMDWLVGDLLQGDTAGPAGGFSAVAAIGLPLGISFYTFQQISYLIDRYRGVTSAPGLASYAAYVSFFPQLIAGPIVLHRRFAPQLRETLDGAVYLHRFLIGCLVFAVGLVKKLYLADNLALYANHAFALAESEALSLWEAWLGTVSYGLQLYFDFSGYSDMAVGLGLMFGLRLPINFESPYQATSIIDFWRRWHITLSGFLREYLYLPLGGSRAGVPRTVLNILVVMILGGLWHGAGWTFVAWGAYHGLLVVLNHAWRGLLPGLRPNRLLAQAVTLVLVMVGWVFFRAADMTTAVSMLGSLVDLSAESLSRSGMLILDALDGIRPAILSPLLENYPRSQRAIAFAVLGLVLCLFAPNLNRLSRSDRIAPLLSGRAARVWVVSGLCALLPGALLLFEMWRVLFAETMAPSEFIYFVF